MRCLERLDRLPTFTIISENGNLSYRAAKTRFHLHRLYGNQYRCQGTSMYFYNWVT